MVKSGDQTVKIVEMERKDLALMRLKLLLIMSMSYLEDCPMGVFRKNAVINNIQKFNDELDNYWAGFEKSLDMDSTHVFMQRTKLLMVMAKAFAKNLPVGFYRKEAMKNNVEKVAEHLGFEIKLSPMIYLKAA
jgi:hypothetical protein